MVTFPLFLSVFHFIYTFHIIPFYLFFAYQLYLSLNFTCLQFKPTLFHFELYYSASQAAQMSTLSREYLSSPSLSGEFIIIHCIYPHATII